MITSFLVLSVFTQQTITNEILDNPSEEGNTRIEGKDRTNSSYSAHNTQSSNYSDKTQTVGNNKQVQTNAVQESSNIKFKENDVNFETWYEGETVRAEQNHVLRYTNSLTDTNVYNPTITGSYQTTWKSDDEYHYFYTDVQEYDPPFQFTSFDHGTSMSAFYRISGIQGSGTLNAEGYAEFTNSGGSASTTEGTISIRIGNEHVINGELEFKLMSKPWYLPLGGGSYDYGSYFVIAVYNYVNREFDVSYIEEASSFSTGSFSWTSLELYVDQITLTMDQTVSNSRSQYQYPAEDIIEHKLEIQNYDYSTDIAVYSPLSWNLTSVNPSAEFEWDDNSKTYNITNTVPVNYELIFFSGSGWGVDYARQKQILAISPVSSDYMQSPSFESGSNDDFTGSGFDDEATNTSIVSDGSFSYRLEATSSGSDTLTLDDLAPGEYVYSFDYYIESSSYSSLQLQYYNDSSWTSVDFDSTVTDRWHTQHVKIHVTNSDYSQQLRFSFSSGQGVIFLDNNQLSQSNAQVVQNGYNDYSFIYQIVSLDNRQNPVVPNLYSNLTLGDRTAASEIQTKSGYSDSNGLVELSWKAGFEVKEYYLKVQTSTNTTYTYFTPMPSNAHSFSYETNGLQNSIKNYWDFSESTLDAFTDTTYSPENIISENGYIQYDSDTTGFWDGITFNEVVDLSNWNYFVTRVKSNISSSSLHFNLINQDGGSHEAWYDSTSTDYNIIIHDISNANFNAKIQLEDSDRSVSTRLTYDFVYLTNTWDQGFAWEFEEHETITEYGSSENTINGWSRIYDRPSDDYYVSNSIIYTESSASYNGIKHNFENKQDLSDYQVQFEIRSDLSTPITIDLRDTSGTLIERILHEETISSEFTYYEIDITASSDVSYIEIFDWAQSNSQFSLKYIRLIDSSQSPSLEVDTTTGLYYFDNGDNSTDYFQIWSNGSSLGIIPEFQFNYLQYQEGMTYSFTYTQIFSDDLRKTHVQTPSTFYEYPYTVEVDFLINNFNFYQSDLDEFLTFHSSKDADVTIYHNNTQVDTATIFEGYNTISSSRDLGPGAIIFYAALFEDGDGNSGWYNTTISNQDPVSEEEFAITGIKDPLYDVGSSTVSIFFQTNWGNATVHTYQNDTLLASNTEGKASVTFDSSVATYNFTYVIDGGKTNITFEDWYTVAESLGIYQVSIDLVNGLGIGIPFETVAVYSNNSGILYRIAKDFIFENDTISIVTADYFGVSLTEATYKLNSSIVNYLSIIVPIFDITFINQYNISVLAVFTRNNQKMRAVIPANASLSVKFSTGPYHFNFNPIYDDPRYTDEIYGNEPLQAFVGSSYGYNHTGISNYRVQLQSQIVKDQPKETITAWQALQYLITIAGLLGAGFLFYGWGKSMYEAGPVDGTIRFFRRKTGEE